MNKKILQRLEKAIAVEPSAGSYEACKCASNCRNFENPAECVHQCYLRNMGIDDPSQIGSLYGQCLVLNTCKCVAKCQKSYGGIGGDINQVRSCAEGCNKRLSINGTGVITGDLLTVCKKALGPVWRLLTEG